MKKLNEEKKVRETEIVKIEQEIEKDSVKEIAIKRIRKSKRRISFICKRCD